MPRRKKPTTLLSIVVTLLIATATYGSQAGWFDAPSETTKDTTTTQPGIYDVTRYVDGDTIVVNIDGKKETIRFIGIDTPETHKPNTPVQCYGPAAAAHTKNVITNAGGKVKLVTDSKTDNRDRYDRLLRYVYLPDGTDLNELNIREGYAFYYPYFPFTKQSEFANAQQDAMSQKKGLWGNCTPTPTDNGGYKMEETEPASN